VGGGGAIGRVSDAMHVVMAFTMASMPWSWGSMFPPTLQIIVFSLITAFYLVLLVAVPGTVVSTDHHSERSILGYHVVMMAAMVYMAVTMLRMQPSDGMDMSGMEMSSEAGGMVMTSGLWLVIGWVLVVLFAGAAVWFLVRLIRPIEGHPLGAARINAGLLLLMSVGMAVGFVP
ncbi:MAG: DUF5134 domain-containing protein, partial [Tomitella sp.]|nr:DUF5134 domain-containing protein [Tomitella sp.]